MGRLKAFLFKVFFKNHTEGLGEIMQKPAVRKTGKSSADIIFSLFFITNPLGGHEKARLRRPFFGEAEKRNLPFFCKKFSAFALYKTIRPANLSLSGKPLLFLFAKPKT